MNELRVTTETIGGKIHVTYIRLGVSFEDGIDDEFYSEDLKDLEVIV